jgi:hypothetical protein
MWLCVGDDRNDGAENPHDVEVMDAVSQVPTRERRPEGWPGFSGCRANRTVLCR